MHLRVMAALGLAASVFAAGVPRGGSFRACSASGWGSDTALNRQKNRAAAVENAESMTVAQLNALPVPRGLPARRRDWSPVVRSLVAQYESKGAVVEGYLLGVNSESMEAGNCFRPDLHDFHLWVGASPSDAGKHALIAEITPRWQAANHAWSKRTLHELARQHAEIRVTGWLMIDEPHTDDIGKVRATVWEIHPITRIDVLAGSEWVELTKPSERTLLARLRARATRRALGKSFR